jgi:hypothetical protein
MKQPSQRLRPSPRPFWKRILNRYKYRDRVLRARVPLVLFRFRSLSASRQTNAGSRSTLVQYPLTLQLQVFLRQSIKNELRPRALIERSIFIRSTTKDLRQVWRDPGSTCDTAPLSNLTARRSANVHSSVDKITVARLANSSAALALPAETTAPAPTSVSSRFTPGLRDVVPQTGRGQKTFRVFTEKVFKNRLHTFITERNILSTSSVQGGELSYRRQKISAGGAWSSPIDDGAAFQQAILPGSRITRALRRNVDTMARVSLPVQSQFIHPEQAEWSNQNSLLSSVQSRLFAQSASLNLANQPAGGPAARPQLQEQTSAPRPPAAVQPSQPQLDIGRLSDEVYRHIQRKIRVERERRGM